MGWVIDELWNLKTIIKYWQSRQRLIARRSKPLIASWLESITQMSAKTMRPKSNLKKLMRPIKYSKTLQSALNMTNSDSMRARAKAPEVSSHHRDGSHLEGGKTVPMMAISLTSFTQFLVVPTEGRPAGFPSRILMGKVRI